MSRKKSRPAPETLAAVLELEEVADAGDGQTMIEFYAQFFDVVNSHAMLFRRGAFAKTLKEGVPAGRVKVNTSHEHSVEATVGKVIEGQERSRGLWLRALLSATATDLIIKLREGVIDETSIEMFSMREGVARVPFAEVPIGAYVAPADEDDMTEVREMLEVSLAGLGIVPFSSQGRDAEFQILSALIPYQDLPLADASTSWDPVGALERLERWAGTVGQCDVPDWAKLSRAHLARGPIVDGKPQMLGQIADVQDGRLVVVPDALPTALAAALKTSMRPGAGPAPRAAADQLAAVPLAVRDRLADDVGRYESKAAKFRKRTRLAALELRIDDLETRLKKEPEELDTTAAEVVSMKTVEAPAGQEPGAMTAEPTGNQPAELSESAPETSPATAELPSEDPDERELRRRKAETLRLRLDAMALQARSSHEPTHHGRGAASKSSSRADGAAATSCRTPRKDPGDRS